MADGQGKADSLLNGDGINFGSPGAVAVGKKTQAYAMGGKANADGAGKVDVDATTAAGYPNGVTITPFTGYNSGNQTAGFGGSAIGVTYGEKPDTSFFEKLGEIAKGVIGMYKSGRLEEAVKEAQGTGATAGAQGATQGPADPAAAFETFYKGLDDAARSALKQRLGNIDNQPRIL